ncbi:F-box/LRR-repeat protein 5-like isoform X1 [Argiope bruennichi]|uniref:F-box/LRR-repeat protein 5-like isoform X1 n=1 Tax=Argiope bruennichi TaxID=94029 RepID=UPI0024948BCE|nr:F-box/LRR-repeat protein 5-like isoform X1 [Argiope bruennichi]
MAPYPEEIDVFSAPHSRMKALVDVYLEKLTSTDFTNYAALKSLLHDLHHTFCEFKSHEQIENKYIMKKLKKRLKLLSIHDAAVCNCHSDNKLSDMLALVEYGYSCSSKTEAERINFGLRLQHALQEFTGSFLPHMKEEEEVFQPMLMKYFEYEELKCLKEQVIEEHSKWHSYEKNILEEAEADLKLDLNEINSENHISKLPPEILTHILSFLSPNDLLQCSEVCHEWYNVAKGPSLWKEIYPCFWAHSVWENYTENHEDCIKSFYPDSKTVFGSCRDEDADVDEYEEEDSSLSDEALNEGPLKSQQKEARALQSIVKHLLPLVGSGVQKIVISSSRSLTSSLLRSILILCPNVLHLDISYTSILDSAFKGLKEHSSCLNLQYLNMAGCENITDLGLFRLADCMAVLPPHVPEGTDHLRDVYLEDCCRFQSPDKACDCFFEIEESGRLLQKAKPCCQCRVKDFCNSVCFWQKDGIMCHLAKLSLQCPFVNSLEQQTNCFKSTGGTFYYGSERIDNKSLRYLNLSGCNKITDEGLRCLFDAGVLDKLQFLDISGCWLLSGPELCSMIESLTHLKPENIFYCDQILDGPYPDSANGCQNLENGFRACCRRVLL